MQNEDSSPAPENKRWAKVAGAAKILLAWFPFAILWTLISLSYAETALSAALRFGALSMGTAALLGHLVWRLTARYQWPDRLSIGFYLAHAALAGVFASSWMILGAVINAVIMRLPLFTWYLSPQLTFWRFLMGLWLYGLIAGISYSLRIREQLREQEKMTLAAQALATQARLESIRAQLNPHFLFNALHSVSELVHADAVAADKALENLANLLRYSLQGDLGDAVTLNEEWAFVDGYLALERLRLGDRLRVHTDLESAALSCEIPSFTMQVLVENAVRHAIAVRPEGGTVRISARVDGASLHLVVADDGRGIPAGWTSERQAMRRKSPGRGLALLRERLEVAYAGQADLSVQATLGGGTTVQVTVPVRPHART